MSRISVARPSNGKKNRTQKAKKPTATNKPDAMERRLSNFLDIEAAG
jgi:hypothetical protein